MSPLARLIRLAASCLVIGCSLAHAQSVDPALQARIDAKLPEIKQIAADPVIVKAVVAQNASLPAAYGEMTQDKWKALTLLDPFVRGFIRNEVGGALKARKAAWLAEAFVNDAKGLKVGFLAKTSGWSHGTSAKHTQPMAGQVWQGVVELDESSGLQQIQVAVPVLAEGKPVGSLVVGLAVSALE